MKSILPSCLVKSAQQFTVLLSHFSYFSGSCYQSKDLLHCKACEQLKFIQFY